jgi:hypothetical protein
MIIFKSVLTTFDVSFVYFEAARAVGNIGSSLKSNHNWQI